MTKEYQIEAEKICRKYGALLIYDEVVTAFRLDTDGAQKIFGTKPDLTIFGKIIGGGYPCAGGIGGRKDLIDMLAAGINKNRDKKVRVGGTLSANPLTAYAGCLTLEEIDRLNLLPKLEETSNKFMGEIAALTDKYDVPALVFNHGSILHIDVAGGQHIPTFYVPGDPKAKELAPEASMAVQEFAMALAAEGVIISGGGKTYICHDTIPHMDDVLAAYERVFSQFE